MRLLIWVILLSTSRTKSSFSIHTTRHFWRLPVVSIPSQTCLTCPVRSYGTLGKPTSLGLSIVIIVVCASFTALYKHVIIFNYKPGYRKEDRWKEDNSVGYEPFLCSESLWIVEKIHRAVHICSAGPAHPGAGGSCGDAAHCQISWCSFVISPASILKPGLSLLRGSPWAWLSISSTHCYPGTWPRLVGNQGPSLISVCSVESWSEGPSPGHWFKRQDTCQQIRHILFLPETSAAVWCHNSCSKRSWAKSRPS